MNIIWETLLLTEITEYLKLVTENMREDEKFNFFQSIIAIIAIIHGLVWFAIKLILPFWIISKLIGDEKKTFYKKRRVKINDE